MQRVTCIVQWSSFIEKDMHGSVRQLPGKRFTHVAFIKVSDMRFLFACTFYNISYQVPRLSKVPKAHCNNISRAFQTFTVLTRSPYVLEYLGQNTILHLKSEKLPGSYLCMDLSVIEDFRSRGCFT